MAGNANHHHPNANLVYTQEVIKVSLPSSPRHSKTLPSSTWSSAAQVLLYQIQTLMCIKITMCTLKCEWWNSLLYICSTDIKDQTAISILQHVNWYLDMETTAKYSWGLGIVGISNSPWTLKITDNQIVIFGPLSEHQPAASAGFRMANSAQKTLLPVFSQNNHCEACRGGEWTCAASKGFRKPSRCDQSTASAASKRLRWNQVWLNAGSGDLHWARSLNAQSRYGSFTCMYSASFTTA